MTSRILEYLRHHALAMTALVFSILALAGSSYAAFTISGSQILNHTISPSKFNPRYINGSVRAWAIVSPSGTVIRGKGGPRVTLQAGDPGGYGIRWNVPVGRCATTATIDFTSSPAPTSGYAMASTNRRSAKAASGTFVQTFSPGGMRTPLAFDVAVIC